MSFIRPPAARPVRAPSRPPSPPRTQQQRQPSPQSRSPQRPQQPAQVSGKGWRHQTSNQPDRPQQQATGGGWRNAGNQQGSQQARPIRGGWPVQVNPLTGERLGLRGGSPTSIDAKRMVESAQREVNFFKRQLEEARSASTNTPTQQVLKIDYITAKEMSLRDAQNKLSEAEKILAKAEADEEINRILSEKSRNSRNY